MSALYGLLRRSLLWRLTVLCLFGLIIVATANTAIWLSKFEDEIEKSFTKVGTDTTEVMSNAIANAVWTFDHDYAAEIMAGFSDIGGFVYAEVFTDEGSFARYGGLQEDVALLQGANTLAGQEDLAILGLGGTVLFKRVIRHDSGREIGMLVTGFSYVPSQALLDATRRETVISQLLSFGLLALLLLLVLRSVTRPLRDITSVIDDVTNGNLDLDVPFLDRLDEVGRLAAAVSQFQINAKALVAVEAEAEVNRRVAELAEIDELTGLANRRAMTSLFEQIETERRHVPDRSIAVLHMDLDGFKKINDTLGHKAGDHMLLVVAERLRDVGKECRLVARIGGDEFVAVLTGLEENSDVPTELADQVIRALRTPTDFEDQSIQVGCSIGIAFHVSSNMDLLETLAQADMALYKAKVNGKNQWFEFDAEQRRAAIARKTLESDLRRGLDRGEFVPHFQPIIDAQTGEITSVEVLSRWRHPQQGLLGPNIFIDVAQELKVLRFIDRTILAQSAEVMQNLASAGRDLPRLAVNVSTERLLEPDFLHVVRELAGSTIKLDVELKESSYIDDFGDRVLWIIDALRDLDIGIHIDDFGTGHSSLAGLLRVLPDAIKIERRFIAGAVNTAGERTVIETMVEIAKKLGCRVVCEGIETEEQADLARTLGCDMLQGFLNYRPMDRAALQEILSGSRADGTPHAATSRTNGASR